MTDHLRTDKLVIATYDQPGVDEAVLVASGHDPALASGPVTQRAAVAITSQEAVAVADALMAAVNHLARRRVREGGG